MSEPKKMAKLESSLPTLTLAERLENELKQLLGKKLIEFFCDKYDSPITNKVYDEHYCLRAKRIYQNKEGKQTVILCPYLKTNNDEKFYKVYESIIYETLEKISSQTGES